MQDRRFRELLETRWGEGKMLCVGLDPDFEKIPERARQRGVGETLLAFNGAIVEATARYACAYKLNSAFYEAHGEEGWNAMRETIRRINENAPEAPVILDGKRGDIGSTNGAYASAAFDDLRADAVTVHPYVGREALEPFFARPEKGVFVLCRTSNPGAGEFQDLSIGGEPLYKVVARHVAREWNARGNCGLVAGATSLEELRQVRRIAPDLPILVPGVGAQGGEAKDAAAAGKDARGRGILVSASRSILYASSGKDFAAAAQGAAAALDGEIRKAL